MRWELHDGNEQVGPLDESQVLTMIRDGLPARAIVRPEGKEAWKGLRAHAPFAMALEAREAGDAIPPPMPIAAPLLPAALPARYGRRIAKSSFLGLGCVVQGLGFMAPGLGFMFGGIIGAAFGLILFLILIIAGSRMARYWKCGACANRLTDGDIGVCPACGAVLS